MYKKNQKWLLAIPKLIAAAATDFNLQSLKPLAATNHTYLLSGQQQGTEIILKLGIDHEGLRQEAAALEYFAKKAARIIAQADGLLLLERLIPGSSLKNHFPAKDLEAATIAAELISKLPKVTSPQKYHFPHLRDWLATLDKNWKISKPYLQKARKLRDQLLVTSNYERLLHGDFHHENILLHHQDWLIIDPKGVIGDPIYEAATSHQKPDN